MDRQTEIPYTYQDHAVFASTTHADAVIKQGQQTLLASMK